jgi:pre-mRNA-splicing factor ISY1
LTNPIAELGYLYFGAARDLPGVRELLEKAQEQSEFARGRSKRKTRADLYKMVDMDYYGYGEEPGDLEKVEREAEDQGNHAIR